LVEIEGHFSLEFVNYVCETEDRSGLLDPTSFQKLRFWFEADNLQCRLFRVDKVTSYEQTQTRFEADNLKCRLCRVDQVTSDEETQARFEADKLRWPGGFKLKLALALIRCLNKQSHALVWYNLLLLKNNLIWLARNETSEMLCYPCYRVYVHIPKQKKSKKNTQKQTFMA
jgi:hypothetical protein